MSEVGEASTASHDQSEIAMSSRNPPCISTTVCTTWPAEKHRPDPLVGVPRPDATADSWSARSRGSPDELAISRPSADTTAACATPGTRCVKPSTGQPTSVPVPVLTSPSLLSGRAPGIVVPGTGSCEEPVARSVGRQVPGPAGGRQTTLVAREPPAHGIGVDVSPLAAARPPG